MAWWYGRDYESVDQKRRKAGKLLDLLRKENPDLKPVRIEGRILARSFWGKAWCRQMDLMADYDNRLSRGRSYARNGAICHLEIRRGEVEAWISGTRMYTVRIQIKPLAPARWKLIQTACRGKIATLLDLLRGKLSAEVMAVVAHPETGIFPLPDEISYTCSCPDWAQMCKHVTAAFYGVGNRLDEEPELLFLLRHADPVELFSLDMPAPSAIAEESPLRDVDLGSLFGIELLGDAAAAPAAPEDNTSGASRREKAGGNRPGQAADPPGAEALRRPPAGKAREKTAVPKKPTGRTDVSGLPDLDCNALTGPEITALREAAGLSLYRFASRLGVTQATVLRWEEARGIVGLHPSSRRKIQSLYAGLLRKNKKESLKDDGAI